MLYLVRGKFSVYNMKNLVVCCAGYLCCHGGDTILLGQLFGMVLSSRIVEALKVYNMFNGSFS